MVFTTNTKLSAPQKAMQKMGLNRPIDLVLHTPLRYEDETSLTEPTYEQIGKTIQFECEVISQQIQTQPRKQCLIQVKTQNSTCLLRLFNYYPNQIKITQAGAKLRVRGELKENFGIQKNHFAMLHPQIKLAGGELPKELTPIYPASAQLPQAYIKKAVQAALKKIPQAETIPEEYIKGQLKNWTFTSAINLIHNPPKTQNIDQLIEQIQEKTHPAYIRLKAEELLAQQLSQISAKKERDKLQAPILRKKQEGVHAQFIKALPFELTNAQKKVSQEIAAAIEKPVPMNRLLQGDVGSGKTIVAAIAACIAIDAGYQCAIMAPTEILAAQHNEKLTNWLAPILEKSGKTIAYLSGGAKTKAKKQTLEEITNGKAALIIGTHAIISKDVKMHRLGLAIIDEQHRFGVKQRLDLRQKTNPEQTTGQEKEPHLLMMSATPIPRTLAMSYWADLDVSTIDELPPNRTPVETKLINTQKKQELIERIKLQIEQGRQAYWVCPLIEESEALDLANAAQTHQEISAAMPQHQIGLLHSKLPANEKKQIMEDFKSGQTKLLVSTTVIEVGVDVPNASIMIIEHSERFGLSQLHQLRGRVGRGANKSSCILLYETNERGNLSETAKARLGAMRQTTDGFQIAQKDLEIRGPGEFLGQRQSGAALLKFADINKDEKILNWAREIAPKMLEKYPKQSQTHIEKWLGNKEEYLKA